MENNNVLEIAKKLVSIPSYVGANTSEKELSAWIEAYLRKYTDLKISKQKVSNNRNNIVASKGQPKIWFCGHMDTVEPKSADQVIPRVTGNVLYGLGSVDMKGGLAAILSSVANNRNINNLGLLFYCDEEYSFKGMKKFIEEFDYKPELAIFAEPTNLGISNVHRGLIEIDCVVKGKTGHAARPWEGVNAILGCVEAVGKLSDLLEREFSDDKLGKTTCTLSRIKGGTVVGNSKGRLTYAQATNSIPDTVEISLDIRPANTGLKSKKIVEVFSGLLKDNKCELKDVAVNADYAALLTPRSSLSKVENIVSKTVKNVNYLKSAEMGYGDGQMLFENTKSLVIYFGPGPASACHKSDEYVNIKDLYKTEKVFGEILEFVSKGGEFNGKKD
jgi:acetylornithine deacetylase/succinyl-diaminopimelate desuccinylase-like protein